MKSTIFEFIRNLMFLAVLIYILWYNHTKQEQRDNVIELLDHKVDSLITINKPLVHKIDSLSDHIHFTDTSHFKWCDFVPNGKYKPYGE